MSPDKQPNQTQVALVEHFGCDARTGGPRPIRVTSAPGAAEPGGRRSRHRGRRATARLSPSVTPIREPGEQDNLIPAVLLATPSAAMTCPSAARIGDRTGADRHLFRPVPATVPAKVKSQPAHPFRLLGIRGTGEEAIVIDTECHRSRVVTGIERSLRVVKMIVRSVAGSRADTIGTRS